MPATVVLRLGGHNTHVASALARDLYITYLVVVRFGEQWVLSCFILKHMSLVVLSADSLFIRDWW